MKTGLKKQQHINLSGLTLTTLQRSEPGWHITNGELTLTYSRLENVSMLSMRHGSCSLSSLNKAKAWSISEINWHESAVRFIPSLYYWADISSSPLSGGNRTSNVVVGHGNLWDNVGALGKASLDEAMIFLQRLFDHLQLCVHLGHEEVFNPAVGQRQRLQLNRRKLQQQEINTGCVNKYSSNELIPYLKSQSRKSMHLNWLKYLIVIFSVSNGMK